MTELRTLSAIPPSGSSKRPIHRHTKPLMILLGRILCLIRASQRFTRDSYGLKNAKRATGMARSQIFKGDYSQMESTQESGDKQAIQCDPLTDNDRRLLVRASLSVLLRRLNHNLPVLRSDLLRVAFYASESDAA